MNQISPLAFVHPEAKLGDNNIIGPFCYIDKDTVLGDNNVLQNSVIVLHHKVGILAYDVYLLRNYAAPVNVQRCNLNPHFAQITGTPCSKTGSCGDCTAADCICSYIVETRMSKVPGRIKIILVDEPLGI